MTRQGDAEPHPAQLAREAAEAEQAKLEAESLAASARAALWMLATSTMLGLVALYPIVRGTQTDNTVMMLIGFVIALVAFKVLPVDKVAGLISAWKGK